MIFGSTVRIWSVYTDPGLYIELWLEQFFRLNFTLTHRCCFMIYYYEQKHIIRTRHDTRRRLLMLPSAQDESEPQEQSLKTAPMNDDLWYVYINVQWSIMLKDRRYVKIRLTMMFEDTTMNCMNWTWWPQDGHYPKALATDTAISTAMICFGPRERSKGPRRELNPKCFMFDVWWYDVWHHTKHIDPKATAMSESNSNVLYFVFHMNVTFTSTPKNRHTMADVLSALTLICWDYWLTYNQRWSMISQ